MNKGKGLIRATSRRGTATKKRATPERATGRLAEPAVCERCGAVHSRRVWRRGRPVTAAMLDRAQWTECPACKQSRSGEYWGRVVIRGAFAAAHRELIRQRIQNVAAHAEITHPERRLVSVEAQDDILEVLTTSQKLAHRIAHELKKLFRGRATYRWSDDGSLFAVWQRD